MRRWLIWNVLFRLHEKAKGHHSYRYLAEMERADRLTGAELAQLQNQKLQDLIEYSSQNVPYYRELLHREGLTPADIRTPQDLRRLPLMRKADVRANREKLRSEIGGKLSSFTTGGSTGDPLIFDLAKRRVASRVACRQRTSRWWGVAVGDPEIAVWGSPVELSQQDWIRGIRDRFLATRLLRAFEMNGPTMSKYLDVIEAGQWRQIFGYPSALYLLCRHAKAEGRNLRKVGLRVAFATGEVLFPYQRELVTEVLGCPVANGYGGRDSALIAHECPQGGMHVLADAVILETLDPQGQPAPAGEPGEIVITDLYSHEAPFIRYATGDLAVVSNRQCACGRALPLLERIEGRANDTVLAPDGRMINSLALIYAVREIEGVERFRITQKTLTAFHIQLVCAERYSSSSEALVRTSWAKLLRADLTVTFEYLAELPAERSGKFRHVVSELTDAPARDEQTPGQAGR